MSDCYIKLDDMVWPNPDDPLCIEHILRYEKPTRSVMLVAASYIAAYRELVTCPRQKRNYVISTLRDRTEE